MRRRHYGKPLPAKRDIKAHMQFFDLVKQAGENEMNREITFTELRLANRERVEYFGHGSLADGWNVAEWGCALAGETGELCNVLKKMHRNAKFDLSHSDLKELAAEEIADVAIYLDLIAAKLGLDLGECIAYKFNSTSEKHDFPQRIGARL